MAQKVDTVITDLDDTLWDWLTIWHANFARLIHGVLAKTGLPREELLSQVRRVHQKHHTSEVSTLLQELPLLTELYPGQRLHDVFADELEQARRARKAVMAPFPTVGETLAKLKARRVLIIGYTESLEFWTSFRLRRMELAAYFDYLYSGPDHDLVVPREELRTLPVEEYQLASTCHRKTPRGSKKPNPEILKQIIRETDSSLQSVAYVGDNLWKDVRMAQDAGVTDVHAAYSAPRDRPEYELLREVSHWTDEDIRFDKEVKRADVAPTHTIEQFSGLLELFDFRGR